MTQELPLSGIRVIDESEGPLAGLATMVLADFGAEVIKLESEDGDPWRRLASARLWLRGKRSVVLPRDAAAAREARSLLARQAQIWVRGPQLADMTERPAATNGAGSSPNGSNDPMSSGKLSDDALQLLNPALVIGWVSAFGRQGPYRDYPPYEALVAAKVGRMLQFRGLPSRAGPVYSALQVATHAASQSLLSGILAALQAVARDGIGQVIETSLLRGLLPYDMNQVLAPQVNAVLRARGEPELPAAPDPATVMPTLYYHPLRGSDGRWIQMGNLLPHLFHNFLRAVDLWEEFGALGESGPPDQWPEAKREAFRDRMLQRLQDKPVAEWQRLFVADGGVASHPYQSTQRAMDDEDLIANGHSVPMGEHGRQLGLLANLTRTPGAVGQRVPTVGEDTEAVLRAMAQTDKNAAPDSASVGGAAAPSSASTRSSVAASPSGRSVGASPRRPPLEGITVVEAATIIAAPFGAALLADLGARVIKFEPLEGDPFRSMAPGLGAARVNTGKECISLDLKKPQARELAQRLLARADVFIHNYRPGVPERLGLDYAALSAINPALVYLSANGYGPAGPGALRPSTHPIPGAALGGVLHQIGGAPDTAPQSLAELRETARRLMRANDVNPDPNTSLVICSAALLGLSARRRLGVGQAIFVDMFGANAYANFDDALRYPGQPARLSPDREGFGLHPLWRLYPCREGWVFLAIAFEPEWQRMLALLADSLTALRGQRFADVCAGGPTAIDCLGALFATARADDWERRLTAQGIGCVRADAGLPEQFFFQDEQSRVEQILLPAQHAQWGDYRRHGAQVVMQGTPGVYRGTGLQGDSTDALLSELGIDEPTRSKLRQAGVVG